MTGLLGLLYSPLPRLDGASRKGICHSSSELPGQRTTQPRRTPTKHPFRSAAASSSSVNCAVTWSLAGVSPRRERLRISQRHVRCWPQEQGTVGGSWRRGRRSAPQSSPPLRRALGHTPLGAPISTMLNPRQHERNEADENHCHADSLGTDEWRAQPLGRRKIAEYLIDGEAERDQRRTGADPRHQRPLMSQRSALHGKSSVCVRRLVCHGLLSTL
jgi:hypothetical protein